MRTKLLMDSSWRFFRGDIPIGGHGWTKSGNFTEGHMARAFNDSTWEEVNLPHDYVIEGPVIPRNELNTSSYGIANLVSSLYDYHGSRPTGPGWYRRRIMVPQEMQGQRLYLEFDGIFRDSRVWVNGHFLKHHLSGFTGFGVDISDVVDYSGENSIVVRVDASEYEGWWYDGGGIYRHVWIISTPDVHIARHGIFITTPDIQDEYAHILVHARVDNHSDHNRRAELSIQITGPDSTVVATGSAVCEIPSDFHTNVECTARINNPHLWSIDSPVLYSAHVTLSENGKNTDDYVQSFGIRTAKFTADRGFILNGKQLKIHGMCCHQDFAGVGVALPDALHERRIMLLKEMGCNAIRCAHNPPAPEMLDACDRLGMLVMDENRLMGSSEETLGQLTEMVLRDRNHPSIILWSLCNEEPLSGTPIGAVFGQAMKRRVRRLDPSRPVCVALNSDWGKGIGSVVDVHGCNYIGSGNADALHIDMSDLPIVFSESATAVTTRGCYQTDASRCLVYSEDPIDRPLWGREHADRWAWFEERPWVAGAFFWTGMDYRGEPFPYKWPATSSQFGVLDLCGFPKDQFYGYRAWWTDKPVIHIFPHWSWPGREGEEIEVFVYSNADEVELKLDETSFGVKAVKQYFPVSWKIPYHAGKLQATGRKKGEAWVQTSIKTAHAPHFLHLECDRQSLKANGEDVVCITVKVVDKCGTLCPHADHLIRFSCEGPATIIGVGNGNPVNHDPERATQVRVFNGLGMVIIQASTLSGEIEIKAMADGLVSTDIQITSVACNQRPSVPAPAASPLRTSISVSHLLPPCSDICNAPPPPQGTTWNSMPVAAESFVDIRSYHSDKHGLVYVRMIFVSADKGKGWLLWGADGPACVWLNDIKLSARPTASNPARADEFREPCEFEKGENSVIIALNTNHGKAWGVFARGCWRA